MWDTVSVAHRRQVKPGVDGWERLHALACIKGNPMPSNDNDDGNDNAGDPARRGVIPVSSDAHGQAALLLVESLIHGLHENATLGIEEAIGIIERAAEVQADHAEAADGRGAPMWQSHALLSSIATSLRAHNGNLPTPRPPGS